MRDEFYALLAEPGPESWAKLCKLLAQELRTGRDPSAFIAEYTEVARELRAWPPEIDRSPPAEWLRTDGGAGVQEVRAARLNLARIVREVDLYPYYIRAAAESQRLRLRDGTPAVRLQRSFSGALQGAHGRMHQIGVPGQGDLCGSLCVEVHCSDATCYSSKTSGGPCEADHWRRLAVALEVEVKRAAGKQSPVQRQREEALRRRGELYLCVRTTAEMLRLLESERDRILRDGWRAGEVSIRAPVRGLPARRP